MATVENNNNELILQFYYFHYFFLLIFLLIKSNFIIIVIVTYYFKFKKVNMLITEEYKFKLLYKCYGFFDCEINGKEAFFSLSI